MIFECRISHRFIAIESPNKIEVRGSDERDYDEEQNAPFPRCDLRFFLRGVSHSAKSGLSGDGKFEGEIDESFLAPVNFSEINARRDFAYFVANPMRQQRRLRIIEHDALLVIEPARAFVDLGDDRVQAERQDFVAQDAFAWIKNFSLPGKVIDEARDILRISCAGCDNRRAFRFARRNISGRTLLEK